MVSKLGLEEKPHPSPYKLTWLTDEGEFVVSKQCEVEFAIHSFKDKVLLDIVPMQATQILLGRPWQFDRGTTHDGIANKYSFVHNGKKIVLNPLSPQEVAKDQAILAQKIKEEKELEKAKEKSKEVRKSTRIEKKNKAESSKRPREVKEKSEEELIVSREKKDKRETLLLCKEVKNSLLIRPEPMYLLLSKEIMEVEGEIGEEVVGDRAVLSNPIPSVFVSLLQELQDIFSVEPPKGMPPLIGLKQIDAVASSAIIPYRPVNFDAPTEQQVAFCRPFEAHHKHDVLQLEDCDWACVRKEGLSTQLPSGLTVQELVTIKLLGHVPNNAHAMKLLDTLDTSLSYNDPYLFFSFVDHESFKDVVARENYVCDKPLVVHQTEAYVHKSIEADVFDSKVCMKAPMCDARFPGQRKLKDMPLGIEPFLVFTCSPKHAFVFYFPCILDIYVTNKMNDLPFVSAGLVSVKYDPPDSRTNPLQEGEHDASMLEMAEKLAEGKARGKDSRPCSRAHMRQCARRVDIQVKIAWARRKAWSIGQPYEGALLCCTLDWEDEACLEEASRAAPATVPSTSRAHPRTRTLSARAPRAPAHQRTSCQHPSAPASAPPTGASPSTTLAQGCLILVAPCNS